MSWRSPSTSRSMPTKAKVLYGFLFLVVALSAPAMAWEELDRIVAVVGDRVILASELEFQIQMYEVQSNTKLDTPEARGQFREELLRQMINDRLILIRAKEDTTIVISEADIDEALEKRLDELRSRFRSQAEFEAQVSAEGYTLRELKNKLRLDIHDQLFKDRLINRMLSKVSVSRGDVEKFYEQYRDSLPPRPEMVKLAHLLLRLEASSAVADSLKAKAEMIRQKIVDGESFELLAQQYSEDPSAEVGGDLGTFRRGDLVPEFEKAALALNPGEISPVVHSPFGYHIIKLVAKTEDNFHTKHILLLEQATGADSLRVENLARALADSATAGTDWGTLVKNYSTDDKSRTNFGELGWFALEELPEVYQRPIVGLEPGQIGEPVWTPEGLHLMKLLEKKDSRAISIDEDYDMLKEYARRQKSSEVIAKVVDEMKDRVYIDLRGI